MSSHQILRRLISGRSPKRILDIGCADGEVTALFVDQGTWVTGIDRAPNPKATKRLSTYLEGNLNDGIPLDLVGQKFDLVLLADVMEHLAHPEVLLQSIHAVLDHRAIVLLSVPNFGHWYPRMRVLGGRWDYDEKGILDKTHLRFFSISSVVALCESAGFTVMTRLFSTTPWELLVKNHALRGLISNIDRFFVNLNPNLFAYQTILCLQSTRTEK